MALEITVTDTETGEVETQTIDHDWLIICHDPFYLAGVQSYPTKGTAVVTIKREPSVEVGEL